MPVRFGIRPIQGVLLLCLLIPAAAAALPVLSIEPPMSQVQLGAIFNVDITVTGIVDLFAYQFDFSYSPGPLQAQAVEEGAFLGQAGTTFFLPGEIDNGTGAIRAIAGTRIGQEPGVSGDGVLAAISFRALGVGSSPLTLSRITLVDSQLQGIAFQTAPASLTVAPEPNALALILVGILSFAFLWHLSKTETSGL